MKRRMNKRAYMRTFEAVLAIIISFLFITFIITSRSPTEIHDQDINLFSILKDNPQFRNCAMSDNLTCINATLQLYYPDFTKVYSYQVNITNDPSSAAPELPRKNIHAESLFIAGNDTFSYPKIVRLYYWDKE